jgi:hypothetical protein
VDLPTPYSDFGPFWRPMNFFWILARCQPFWISTRCWPLLDFGKLSALLDFGPLLALLDFGPLLASFGFWPIVGPLGFRPVVDLFWISARCQPSSISARCRPFFGFWPASAPFGVWPIVGPFESTFSNYMSSLLATRQPLSSLAVSTIYGPFPTSATAIIIISYFKLKVAEYSTLSLRGMLEYNISYSIIYIYCLSY